MIIVKQTTGGKNKIRELVSEKAIAFEEREIAGITCYVPMTSIELRDIALPDIGSDNELKICAGKLYIKGFRRIYDFDSEEWIDDFGDYLSPRLREVGGKAYIELHDPYRESEVWAIYDFENKRWLSREEEECSILLKENKGKTFIEGIDSYKKLKAVYDFDSQSWLKVKINGDISVKIFDTKIYFFDEKTHNLYSENCELIGKMQL